MKDLAKKGLEMAEYVHVFFCVFFVYVFLVAGVNPGFWVSLLPGLASQLAASAVIV